MSITESQLQMWSNIGATELTQKTHTSIRDASDSFKGWQGRGSQTYGVISPKKQISKKKIDKDLEVAQ